MTTPGDADDGGDVRKFVDEELSKMRFVTESSEAVAEWVAEAVEAEVAVIVKARLGESSRQVTAGSAPVADASTEPSAERGEDRPSRAPSAGKEATARERPSRTQRDPGTKTGPTPKRGKADV